MTTKPKRIRIMGQPFKVEFKEVVKMDEGGIAQGLMSCQKGLIEIRESNPVLEVDTFIHEILHALEYKMGLEHNEHYVNRFAAGLTQVLKDNPTVLRYITERLKEAK